MNNKKAENQKITAAIDTVGGEKGFVFRQGGGEA